LRNLLNYTAEWECGLWGIADVPLDRVNALQERALRLLALLSDAAQYAAFLKRLSCQPAPQRSVFASVGELQPTLFKFKKAREGKWRFDSQTMLDDAAHLAVYLLALDRTQEARRVVEEALPGCCAPPESARWYSLKCAVLLAYIEEQLHESKRLLKSML